MLNESSTIQSAIEAATNANALMYMPTPSLRPFIDRFVIVEFPFDRSLRLMPTTSFLAEFRFRGDCVLDSGAMLPRAVISGLRDTSVTRSYMGGSAILLTKFTEIGARAFLSNSLDTFFNNTLPMEKVLGSSHELGIIDEELTAAKDHIERIQIAEGFLLEHLRKTRLDPIISAAVARIEQNGTTIRIEELARQMGLSQSALERRFRRKVGTSPKRFESILRFKNAIRLGVLGQDFTSIAHSAGYTDQSHFINHFKRATGFAPSIFFRQSAICKTAEFLQVAFTSN